MVDVGGLLLEARELPPGGPNLEHDLSFFELEEAARGKPEQSVGDTVKPGEDPSWPKVVDLARDLLMRSKDVRLAVYLTRGLAHTDGLPGFAAGLGLVHGLLDRYWETVHPVLEADRDNDPTERMSALAPLADPETVLRDLRDVFLVDSREHGQLQVRQVEMALGRLAPTHAGGAAAVKPLSQVHAQVAAALATDRTVPMAVAEARGHALAIEALVGERAGAAGAIDLKPLVHCLESLREVCEATMRSGTPSPGAERLGPAGGEGVAGQGASGMSALAAGEIQSREQALRALELVCRYLERHEPSNPAPLFIRRAQRLMAKSFVEIVKDLMPDSLSHLEQLAGELDQT